MLLYYVFPHYRFRNETENGQSNGICLLMSQDTSALDLTDDDLLLYFSFDGEDMETVKDLSAHGNDGTVSGNIDYEDGKAWKST